MLNAHGHVVPHARHAVILKSATVHRYRSCKFKQTKETLYLEVMSGPTALTASVWGQGRAAIHLSNQAAALVNDADEECMICRDDVPATIAFVPCSHRVCFACVENMRAKNIFKVMACSDCIQHQRGFCKSLLGPSLQL